MRTFLPRFITLLCLCYPMLTHANQAQTYSDSAEWAKHTANQTLTPSALPLNAKDYCKDAACKSGVDNPKESQLDDSAINSQKAHAFATNDTAQDITHNFNQGRPDIKNDPAMRFALLGQENAFEVTHGISNAYVDCKTGKQCLPSEVKKQCRRPTHNPVICEEVPLLKNPTLTTGITLHPATLIKESPYNQYQFGSASLPDGADALIAIDIPMLFADDLYGISTDFYVNDRLVYTYKGTNKDRCGPWDECISNPNPGRIVLSPPLPTPDGNVAFSQTIRLGNQSTSSQNWWTPSTSPVQLVWGKTTYDITWKKQCTALIPQCKPQKKRCTEGKETRNIDGVSVTLDCWKYQTTYQCDLPDTCQSLPKDCVNSTTQCSLKQNGTCVEEEVTKLCQEEHCRATQMQCGEQSFCLDGDCYQETPKLNANFDKSVAALAGLAEAVKDVGSPPKIFTGKPMQCEKKIAGFNDCCSDSGWGQGLGAKCSEQEKALGKAKGKGLTLYVGEFCAKKILGACFRHKRSYCVYDSKLAKIIQQQGAMSQLGKGLGSSERPTCAPLTPEELGQINFEHIDFAEFYPEMKANTNLPNFDEIKNRLQSATGG